MSDDEGDYGEAYGDDDYDADLADGPDELGVPEEKEDEAPADDEDQEDEAEVADEERAEAEAEAESETEAADLGEAEDEEHSLSRPAAAARVRVDPILRVSNTHRRIIIITGDDRNTSNVIQIPEAARAIAIRAKQIERTPMVFVDIQGETDSVAIATKEFLARRCPLKLRRVVGRGSAGEVYVEEWAIHEMVIPPLDAPVAR